MKIRLLAVLSATLFFYAVYFFKPPAFLAVGVLLPSILLSAYLLAVYYNATVSGNFNPVVPAHEGDRLKLMNSDVTLMQSLHFQKIDSFLASTIPESLAIVFMLPSESVFVIVRLFEHKKTWELVTFFDGSDLTTGSDVEFGNAPRSIRHPLQIFPNDDPVSLLDRHRAAVSFLVSRGRKPAAVPASEFRKTFLVRHKELAAHLRSFPFWPFRLAYWAMRRQGRRFCSPLNEQSESVRPLSGDPSAMPVPVPARPHAARFRVVFRGAVREGFTLQHVRDNLSRKFRLDSAKADAMFSGNPVVVRSGADETAARKVKDAFYRVGALCVIEVQSDSPASREASEAAGSSLQVEANQGEGKKEFERFEIQRLLTSDRAALEKDFKAQETLGWLPYALALTSFVPAFGIAGGIGSILYGLAKRRMGGMKIVLIGSAGLILTLMSGVSDFYVKMKQPAQLADHAPVRQTEIRLNGLVRELEAFRERNGRYPEALVQVQEQSDTTISIWDPMDDQPPDVEQRRLVYEPDRSGESYRLYSAGSDGVAGTEDDIFPGLAPEELAETGYRR